MKSCSVALNSHTQQGQTTLARLLQVTRQVDGAIYGFTTHDQPIVLGGVTYVASSSFNSANMNAKLNGEAKTTELTGAFDTVITRADVLAGLWNFAQFQVLLVNWADLTMGSAILMTGNFGDFECNEFSFKVSLHGLAYPLTFIGGDLAGPTCRADFGDSKCAPGGVLANGTTIASLQQTGSVSSTPDGYRTLVVSGISNIGKPLIGAPLTFTSGANINLTAEVMNIVFGASVTITLRPWIQIAAVAPGDAFNLGTACDKVRTTCDYVYINILNNQSEPDAPDPDATIEYPDYVAPGTNPANLKSSTIPLG